MTTIIRDPKEAWRKQAHLALNGWVGASPLVSPTMDPSAVPLPAPALLCNTPPATDSRTAALLSETAKNQD